MRDYRAKLRLIWLILTDQYTSNWGRDIWWMWDGKTTIFRREFKDLPDELK